METTGAWKGILPIVITPFTDAAELDEASLTRQVEFCVEAGVQGLVGPANASEFTTLSDDERRRWLQVVIAASGDRVPVIASITSGHELPAAELGRYAEGLGAAGVMSMPPLVLPRDQDGCMRFYEHLSQQLQIPIVVQNFNAPLGTPMSASLLARMCQELEGVEYIKEEVAPEPQQITATLATVGDACRGIFGGQGGIFLIDEFLRGAAGNMPGSHNADVLVAIWELLVRGDEEAARERFNRILPLMSYERLYGLAVYKEVLVRRGLIASARRRVPGADIDRQDRRELDRILADIDSLLSGDDSVAAQPLTITSDAPRKKRVFQRGSPANELAIRFAGCRSDRCG